jgi:hypothetical protein
VFILDLTSGVIKFFMKQDKQNLTTEELLWQVYESSEKTKKLLIWWHIMNAIKMSVLILAIILGIIYLPKVLQPVLDIYKDLLGFTGGTNNIIDQAQNLKDGGVDINKYLEMYGL